MLVGGSPLEAADQARLVRARVDLDAELLAETHLLFIDPELSFINGSTFDSGKRIGLKMGFGAAAEDVFDGEVVRLEPQFRRDQPVALLVIAQEALHRLALKQNTRAFNDADAADVLSQVAQENGLTADAPSGTKGHVLQNNLTDAAFLKRMASRMGLRLKLADKKLTLAVPPSAAAIQLSLDDGVKKIKVKRKAQGQVATVTVHGWDEKTKAEVTGSAQPEGVTGKGAADYGKGTLSDASGDLLPVDVSSAEALAKGKLKKIAEGFSLLSAELIGDARLVPGATVELDKLGAGVDGKYRVERARHEFSKQGYFVKLEAVWTGPKDPPAAQPPPAEQPYTPPTPSPHGRLTRPRWKRRTQGDQDTADLAVDGTKPLEGKSVKFILETKTSGEWKQVAAADGTISKGVATGNAPLDPLPAADALSAPQWTQSEDKKHQHGDQAEVIVKCKLPDPQDVRIVLEQQLVGGRIWEELDAQVVKTSGGEAKATFDIEHPHHEEAGKSHSEILGKAVWLDGPGSGDDGEGDGRVRVEAPGLDDGRKVRITIERQEKDGKWAPLKRMDASVEGGVAEAPVALEHASDQRQPDAAVQLSAPKWQEGDLAHGDEGTLTVEAPDLDGRHVRFVVERHDDGEWTPVGEVRAEVREGKAEAAFPVAHPADDSGDALEGATYDPETGVASVDAEGEDGKGVSFTVERKAEDGWREAGHFVAALQGGKASVQVGPKGGGKLGSPSWSEGDLEHGDEVTVSVEAPGLPDGRKVYFTVERFEDGAWVASGTAAGKVASGKAQAKIAVEHPAAAGGAEGKLRFRASSSQPLELRVRAALMADQEPRKLRFRAELMPDLTPHLLRFRAEPVPDLRPRKLRFRAELPVPEGPLTRLTVKLVGGTDDDTVSSAASKGS